MYVTICLVWPTKQHRSGLIFRQNGCFCIRSNGRYHVYHQYYPSTITYIWYATVRFRSIGRPEALYSVVRPNSRGAFLCTFPYLVSDILQYGLYVPRNVFSWTMVDLVPGKMDQPTTNIIIALGVPRSFALELNKARVGKMQADSTGFSESAALFRIDSLALPVFNGTSMRKQGFPS